MLAGVDLLVELIRARDRRRTFDDQWDRSQAEGRVECRPPGMWPPGRPAWRGLKVSELP